MPINVRDAYQLFRALRHVGQDEWRSPHRFRHLGLLRRGFVSDRYELYGLTTEDPSSLYVSDFARVARGQRINDRRFVPVLQNKYVFHEVLAPSFGRYLPRLLGVVVEGKFLRTGDGGSSGNPSKSLVTALDETPGLVVKPIDGGGGKGVHVLRRTPSGLAHNGRPIDPPSLRALQRTWNGYVVTEVVDQHPYAAKIFPAALNTMRVAMLRDVDTDEPFIPAAVHRFGNSQSAPTDNVARGGMTCPIDLDTGEMGELASLSSRGSLVRYEEHPETGARIRGVVIPMWDQARQLVIDVARALPYLSYVGWDVAMTEHGPKLIEGNHFMDISLFQVHQPLLRDERVRAFYERHGVVGRRRGRRRAPVTRARRA